MNADRSPGRLERLPLHPLLLAVFPVLFLWGQNVHEVFPEDVWPVLLLVFAGVAAIWVLAALALRDLGRGALVASLVAVVALSYGHVASAVEPWVGLTLVALVLVVGTAAVQAGGAGAVHAATGVANVVALVLVVTALPPLVAEAFDALGASGTRAAVAEEFEGDVSGPVRDIYYVILDRYPREDSLQEVFGYDNSDFTRSLEDHGFDVAQESLANYPRTAHSLAASLNMTYLDRLEETVPASQRDDWGPVYRMLDDHRVGEVLTDAGYEYVHLGTWWAPTATSVHADRVLTYDTDSEFTRLFRSTTVWPAVEAVLGAEDAPRGNRELLAAFTRHQFDVLDRLADDRGNAPRFVFAHLTVPHEPYVFEPDGTFVPAEVEAARNRVERFVPHLQYANQRIQGLVERLLAGRAPEDQPIVVIQSDEGPHPVSTTGGRSFSWLELPVSDVREKLRILNAYHLPGLADGDVPEDITPVNTFRLILRHYFGAELPPLPDVAYVFPDESRLYRFTDVTDRVRG